MCGSPYRCLSRSSLETEEIKAKLADLGKQIQRTLFELQMTVYEQFAVANNY
jgi:hypothetical protein